MATFSTVPEHVWTHAPKNAIAILRTLNRALRNALSGPSQFNVAKSKLSTNARNLVQIVGVIPKHLSGGKYTVYRDPITEKENKYKTIQNMMRSQKTFLMKKLAFESVKKKMEANSNMLPFAMKARLNKMLKNKKKRRSGKVFPQSFFTRL